MTDERLEHEGRERVRKARKVERAVDEDLTWPAGDPLPSPPPSKEQMGEGDEPVERAVAQPVEAAVGAAQRFGIQWSLGLWHGMPVWRCDLCAWDTMAGEEAIREHLRAKHRG